MKKAMVKFSVGVEHPLYNKYVEAEILSENCGYDGKRIYGKTVDEVFWKEDKKGILVYKGDKLIRYETNPAHSKIHEGYIEEIKG